MQAYAFKVRDWLLCLVCVYIEPYDARTKLCQEESSGTTWGQRARRSRHGTAPARSFVGSGSDVQNANKS